MKHKLLFLIAALTAITGAFAARSPIEVKQVIPENNTTIRPNADGTGTILINFTGPVKITSAGMYSPAIGLTSFPHTPAPDANVDGAYADSWIVTLTKSYLSFAAIDENQLAICNVYVEDKDGKDIYFKYEDADLAFMALAFKVDNGSGPGVDFIVNLPERVETSMNSFTVDCLEQYTSIGGGGQMYDEDRGYYSIVEDLTVTGEDFEAHGVSLGKTVRFEPPITKTGDYTLFIPYHAFTITGREGGEMDGESKGTEGTQLWWSQEKTINFHLIVGDDTPDTPDPEPPVPANGPKVSAVYPQPSTSHSFNLFTYPEVMINFDTTGDTRFGQVELKYQTAEGEAYTPVNYKEQVELDWRSGREKVRYDFDVKGAITAVKPSMLSGTVMTLVIQNPTIDGKPVVGNYVDAATGNIELNYLYLRQTSITDVTYPDPFLSFWREGDPEGVVVLTFDADLAPMERQDELQVNIYAGDANKYLDSGDDWPQLPTAPAYIEGNKLTLDLSGVVRIPEDRELDVVTVTLFGLRDSEGNEADIYGGNRLWIFNIPLKCLSDIVLTYEYTPSANSLEKVDNVEMWVQATSFERIEINGFTFTIEDESKDLSVGLEDVKIEDDLFDAGSKIYIIPVPDEVRAASGDIRLTPDVTFLDGQEEDMSVLFHNESKGTAGVDGIDAAGSEHVIITIDGKLLRGTTPSELQPGIYIIDGKKVVK